jgi:hypothetical protein
MRSFQNYFVFSEEWVIDERGLYRQLRSVRITTEFYIFPVDNTDWLFQFKDFQQPYKSRYHGTNSLHKSELNKIRC